MTKKAQGKGSSSRTTISLRAPAAHSVCVAGSFNDWQPDVLAAKKKKGGVWSLDLALPPGRYEYKFVVDGVWCCDVEGEEPVERAESCVPNQYGTMNRVLDVQN